MPTLAPATPAPFTLESLIAWLETMPPQESYRFECTDGSCLIGQYSTAHGQGRLPYYQQTEAFANAWGGEPDGLRISHAERLAVSEPWTFGAALTRARAYQAGAK